MLAPPWRSSGCSRINRPFRDDTAAAAERLLHQGLAERHDLVQVLALLRRNSRALVAGKGDIQDVGVVVAGVAVHAAPEADLREVDGDFAHAAKRVCEQEEATPGVERKMRASKDVKTHSYQPRCRR